MIVTSNAESTRDNVQVLSECIGRVQFEQPNMVKTGPFCKLVERLFQQRFLQNESLFLGDRERLNLPGLIEAGTIEEWMDKTDLRLHKRRLGDKISDTSLLGPPVYSTGGASSAYAASLPQQMQLQGHREVPGGKVIIKGAASAASSKASKKRKVSNGRTFYEKNVPLIRIGVDQFRLEGHAALLGRPTVSANDIAIMRPYIGGMNATKLVRLPAITKGAQAVETARCHAALEAFFAAYSGNVYTPSNAD